MLIEDFYPIPSLPVIILLSASLLCCLWLVTLYRRRISSIRRKALACITENIPSALPPISIIVYSKDSSEALDRLLGRIFNQDYPSPYEVIVATDGRSLHAEAVVGRHCATHRNLRMTYVPDEAHALSRKKLAVTLGIKAAKYENVLLTDANVTPQSNLWLLLMARHFSNGKQVVIGSASPVGEEGKKERSLAAFDTLADKTTYLSAAIDGHPYRATDKNLAFCRSLFFDNRGFADSVGYQHGIDDIFLSRIAHPGNCAVELSPDAIVSLNCRDLHTYHLIDKLQHLFTGRDLYKGSRLAFGFGSLLMWIWFAVTVALGVMAWLCVPADAPFRYENLVPASVSLVFGIIWLTTLCISWKRAARALSVAVTPWLLPLDMFCRPFSNLLYRLRSSAYKSANFTWAKGY